MADNPRHLAQWMLLSVAAAVATMALKFGAALLTGSVSLFSDAVESSANLVAGLVALGAIWYASRPADRTHPYGHQKIEFFAAAVEGGLVLVAALSIVWYAVRRLFDPAPIGEFELGSILSILATVINLGVARLLLRQAAEHESTVLEADGRHLMTDVWTSVGVIAGLVVVAVTGVTWLDPLIAIAVAVNVLFTAYELIRVAFDGLMDRALPLKEEELVRLAVERQLRPGETYHALRTRRAGNRRFADLHVLVPGEISVARAHKISVGIEQAVAQALPRTETTVHIEPVEDRRAWEDSPLLPLEPKPQLLPHPEPLFID